MIIFIRYKNNGYHFICYTQWNIILCSTHIIFDKENFPTYTNSHEKECKLYNKLLDKISPETELLAPKSSGKNELALVSISSIQNNPSVCSPSLTLSYKFPAPLPILEIKEDNDVDSDVEM